MQIMTYKDPFKINENPKLWEMMCQCPQLCASDTLAQGLARNYDRCSFQYLRSIEHVFKRLYGKWTNNIAGDMKIYLDLSVVINEIEDGQERRVFKNNIQHVLESIKLLLILGIEVDEFPQGCIDKDQRILFQLYKKLKCRGTFKHFYPLLKLTKEDLEEALRLGVVEEILREVDKQDYLIGYRSISDLIKQTQRVLDEEITRLAQKKYKRGLIKDKVHTVTKLKHLRSLLNQELLQRGKIIIHGIHRITPLMYFFFEQLQKNMNIEPIFVFNYCEEYPNVYDTWKQVYRWTNTKLELAETNEMIEISNIGRKLGDLLEGRLNEEQLNEQLLTFTNLTNFSNLVADIYAESYEKERGNLKKVLANMRVQYYATNPNTSNNMLKMYYPEQFGERQFLAYPIGQFILGLYNMWDFEAGKMRLKEQSLEECISVSMLISDKYQLVREVYDKIKVYFGDIVDQSNKDIDHFIIRVDYLEKQLEKLKKGELLEGFAFFSITEQELKVFRAYVVELKKIVQLLFGNMEKEVQYELHFTKLIQTINDYTKDNDVISKVEKELISNINNKLEKATLEEIRGLREDVRKAMFLYLAQQKQESTSDWIVRGFEQLDGAVLLSEFSKAQKYHIGLVSEKNMSLRIKDELSWPLTESFLESYKGVGQAVEVTLTALRQQRNFMKYSLFYVLAFAKKEIELGYIVEENDEINTPYFLLELLGVQKQSIKENLDINLPMNSEDCLMQVEVSSKKMTEEQKETFAICPYKFFLTEGIHVPLIYREEFQMRYLLTNYIQINFQNGIYTRENIEAIKQDIKGLFPFWDDIVINDVINKALSQSNINRKARKQYMRRKKNFLVAAWTDQMSGENYMDFEFDQEYFKEYMNSPRIYMDDKYIPYEKICDCCNLESICLMNYYWDQETIQEK